MIRKQIGNNIMIHFNSLNEVIKYNRETKHTEEFKNLNSSTEVSFHRDKFTGTHTYEEAEDLLLHGWDEMAKELNDELNKIKTNNLRYKNKTNYNVAGYQCSVPRYLQGIPTNMISSKRVQVKQKVINITKDFGYDCSVSKETIKKESLKVLKLVRDLESQGFRVNLNISLVCGEVYYSDKLVGISIKIKNASQKLNLKQVAFPLVHPSMFRRIIFGLIERLPDCKNFGTGYGRAATYSRQKSLFKNEYLIPAIVAEKEITDIERYKC